MKLNNQSVKGREWTRLRYRPGRRLLALFLIISILISSPVAAFGSQEYSAPSVSSTDGGSGSSGPLSSDANLSNLVLSQGILSPAFSPDITDYTASVPNDIASITVTPTLSDTVNGKVYVNGTEVASGQPSNPIDLVVGENTVSIKVYAQDSSTKTYTVVITRAAGLSSDASLSNLFLSQGTLSPSFSPEITEYTANVAFHIASITVTPTLSDTVNGKVYVNGTEVASGQPSNPIPLLVMPNPISIVVYAQDGTTKNYKVTVTREPANFEIGLTNIALSQGTLNPAFSPEITNYTATVPHNVTSLTVTPTFADPEYSNVYVNGEEVDSGQPSSPISLAVGANTINVVLTVGGGPSGILSGRVIDAVYETSIQGATITAYSGENYSVFYGSTTSDAGGNYQMTLEPGTYKLIVSKEGYFPEVIIQTVQRGVTVYSPLLRAVTNVNVGTGTVKGTIVNALTGQGVGGLTITFRKGLDVTTGEVAGTTTTNANGEYSIDLDAGNYTGEITGQGYSTGYIHVVSLGGGLVKDNQNGAVTPIIQPGETRIVLTWGERPADLDSHLTGPTSDGLGRFHIYYSNRVYSVSGTIYADLDRDDVDSYGPETTTVYHQVYGVYRFSVHDYTNRGSTSSTALSNSGATVRVFRGQNLIAQYNVPPNREGTKWTVFEMDGDTLTPINEMSYEGNPASITALGYASKPQSSVDSKEGSTDSKEGSTPVNRTFAAQQNYASSSFSAQSIDQDIIIKTYTIVVTREAARSSGSSDSGGGGSSWVPVVTPPGIVETVPVRDATDVALDAIITATFDQDVSAVNLGGVSITDENNRPVGGVRATLDGKKLVISHDKFDLKKRYTVFIPSMCVKNSGGQTNGQYFWSFQTVESVKAQVSFIRPSDGEQIKLGDTVAISGKGTGVAYVKFFARRKTATEPPEQKKPPVNGPIVITTDPAPNTKDVPLDKTITVTFSEDIQYTDVRSNITFTDAGGNPVKFNRGINGKVFTIDPVQKLAYGTEYTVTIPAGFVKDKDGNTLAEMYSFTFATELDPNTLEIKIINPMDGCVYAKNKPIKVYATASNAIAMNLYLVVNGQDQPLLEKQQSGSKLDYAWNVSALEDGIYTLKVTAFSASKKTSSKTIKISLGDAVAPIVTVSSPKPFEKHLRGSVIKVDALASETAVAMRLRILDSSGKEIKNGNKELFPQVGGSKLYYELDTNNEIYFPKDDLYTLKITAVNALEKWREYMVPVVVGLTEPLIELKADLPENAKGEYVFTGEKPITLRASSQIKLTHVYYHLVPSDPKPGDPKDIGIAVVEPQDPKSYTGKWDATFDPYKVPNGKYKLVVSGRDFNDNVLYGSSKEIRIETPLIKLTAKYGSFDLKEGTNITEDKPITLTATTKGLSDVWFYFKINDKIPDWSWLQGKNEADKYKWTAQFMPSEKPNGVYDLVAVGIENSKGIGKEKDEKLKHYAVIRNITIDMPLTISKIDPNTFVSGTEQKSFTIYGTGFQCEGGKRKITRLSLLGPGTEIKPGFTVVSANKITFKLSGNEPVGSYDIWAAFEKQDNQQVYRTQAFYIKPIIIKAKGEDLDFEFDDFTFVYDFGRGNKDVMVNYKMFEKLGAETKYDNKDVSIKLWGDEVKVGSANNAKIYVVRSDGSKSSSKGYYVLWKNPDLSKSEGRPFVPLFGVIRALGYNAEWSEDRSAVIVNLACDLSIDSIIPVQVLVYEDLPLIRNKDTAIRVVVKKKGGPELDSVSVQVHWENSQLTGKSTVFYVYEEQNMDKGLPYRLINNNVNYPLKFEAGDSEKVIYFFSDSNGKPIRPQIGEFKVSAILDYDNKIGELNENNNSSNSKSFQVIDTQWLTPEHDDKDPHLRIRFVRADFDQNSNDDFDKLVNQVADFLKGVLPIPEDYLNVEASDDIYDTRRSLWKKIYWRGFDLRLNKNKNPDLFNWLKKIYDEQRDYSPLTDRFVVVVPDNWFRTETDDPGIAGCRFRDLPNIVIATADITKQVIHPNSSKILPIVHELGHSFGLDSNLNPDPNCQQSHYNYQEEYYDTDVYDVITGCLVKKKNDFIKDGVGNAADPGIWVSQKIPMGYNDKRKVYCFMGTFSWSNQYWIDKWDYRQLIETYRK